MSDEIFTPVNVNDTERRLFVSRPKENGSDAFSPCDMTPDDVDYEMSRGKSRTTLEICGMNQESFEYFAERYGDTYEYLSFFKCQLISDFSPLSRLGNLRAVNIFWNIRASELWDMSGNMTLTHLKISDCKKLTGNLHRFKWGDHLKYAEIRGSMFDKYHMESLSAFEGMDHLESLTLREIKLKYRSTDVLKRLGNLTEFNFDAGMFTTEEIAYMCARYPHVRGTALCPYNTVDATMNDVRVCGYLKPGLDLPAGQKRLDKYVAEFNALVEKYKTEEL